MGDLRSFTPVEPNVAGKALIAVQAVITKIKEAIVGNVAKGVSEDEITRQLNKIISDFCKTIGNEALREQNRKALVTAAKKWYYTTTRTFETVNRNLLSMSGNVYRLGVGNDSKSYFNTIRPMHDRGINIGKPLIEDYKRSVRLAMKALAADPPLVVTRKDGVVYKVPIRNRAEMAVRYDANVKDLQKFAQSGVDLVWTSQHPNCSPRCKDYQGKLWSISGKSGNINGITYRPLSEALQGKLKDGNGIITGYNCRHRLIEYTENSRPPQELSEAQIKKEYAIDTKQRAYENNIRHMKTNERLLRAAGDAEGAKQLRRKWRKATLLYQAYSFRNGRAYYPDRCTIDDTEVTEKNANFEKDLQNKESGVTIDTQDFVPATTIKEAEEQAKEFSENVNYSGVKNVDALNTVNKTLKRLTTEYPIDKLETISAIKTRANFVARANSKKIELNIKDINNPPQTQDLEERRALFTETIKDYKQRLSESGNSRGYQKLLKSEIARMQESLKYKRWGVSDSSDDPLATITTHEYGHILARQYFGLGEYQSSYEIEIRGQRSRILVESAYLKAKETGDIYNISEYASSRKGEFFAECFAAYINGEQLPDYIEKMLKETLKK